MATPTREDVLAAALELGQQVGETGLTMRALAGKLGVSATALYQHFDGKDAIRREIRLYGIRALGAALADAFAEPLPVARLRAIASSYLTFARQNPWLYMVLFEAEEIDWSQVTEAERDDLLLGIRQGQSLVEEGVRTGAFRPDGCLDSAATRLWASLHGFAMLVIHKHIRTNHPLTPVPDASALERSFVEALVHGYLAAPAASSE
jgi:AcrR family transcriptional regulator